MPLLGAITRSHCLGAIVRCHCWVPLLVCHCWVPLWGAMAGCHCWCHCCVPLREPLREKIDQSVTPFSAALFSALITHKNWLVLSGVYAGIIFFLRCCSCLASFLFCLCSLVFVPFHHIIRTTCRWGGTNPGTLGTAARRKQQGSITGVQSFKICLR